MSPLRTYWKVTSMSMRLMPLSKLAITRAPTRAPAMVPSPPAREEPPMTTAAIASNSKRFPAVAEAALSRAFKYNAPHGSHYTHYNIDR